MGSGGAAFILVIIIIAIIILIAGWPRFWGWVKALAKEAYKRG